MKVPCKVYVVNANRSVDEIHNEICGILAENELFVGDSLGSQMQKKGGSGRKMPCTSFTNMCRMSWRGQAVRCQEAQVQTHFSFQVYHEVVWNKHRMPTVPYGAGRWPNHNFQKKCRRKHEGEVPRGHQVTRGRGYEGAKVKVTFARAGRSPWPRRARWKLIHN